MTTKSGTRSPALSLLFAFGIGGISFSISLILGLEWFLSFYLLYAGTAFFFSLLLKQPPVWIVFVLILPVALLVASAQALPTYILTPIVVVLLTLYLPTLWTKVPYFISSNEVIDEVSALISERSIKEFLDPGCGNGKVLRALSIKFPDIRFTGYEISPLSYLIAKIVNADRRNVEIHMKSFWRDTFQKYNFIYTFLAPPVMSLIYRKFVDEAREGALLVSNSFSVSEVPPDLIIELDGKLQNALYIYSKKA